MWGSNRNVENCPESSAQVVERFGEQTLTKSKNNWENHDKNINDISRIGKIYMKKLTKEFSRWSRKRNILIPDSTNYVLTLDWKKLKNEIKKTKENFWWLNTWNNNSEAKPKEPNKSIWEHCVKKNIINAAYLQNLR